VAAVSALGLTHSFTHISTGGGASLELLEGLGMPGLRALAAAARKHQTQQ
jgi:phosphoglycerate kinase